MTGPTVGVKCFEFIEPMDQEKYSWETWWDCTILAREEHGLAVQEVRVQKLLVQDIPLQRMALQQKITGTGAGEKYSESTRRIKVLVLLSIQMMM